MFSYSWIGEQRCPRTPRPRNSSVPSCRSSQNGGLCRKTRLVSSRLGGGATTGPLGSEHQGDERERGSNQKEHRAGSIRCRPVRRQAPSLPQGLRGDKALEIKRL